jgi:hypothetical protein
MPRLIFCRNQRLLVILHLDMETIEIKKVIGRLKGYIVTDEDVDQGD